MGREPVNQNNQGVRETFPQPICWGNVSLAIGGFLGLKPENRFVGFKPKATHSG